MIYCITSVNVLNGFPFLAGGGFDCSPTFATMSGCVAIVASALDMEPKTNHVSIHPMTKNLPDLLNASHGFSVFFPGYNPSLNR
jgi:hypothetical protein